MISAEIAGALILAVPAIVAAWIALHRRGMALFLFAAAMIVVGVGSDAGGRDGGHRPQPASGSCACGLV